MNRLQQVQARTAAALKAERPTIPAPAYAACRAAALRAQIAHEQLVCERETWPAPASADLDWEVES